MEDASGPLNLIAKSIYFYTYRIEKTLGCFCIYFQPQVTKIRFFFSNETKFYKRYIYKMTTPASRIFQFDAD